MTRKPTKLKPSEGALKQPHEDILPGQLRAEIDEVTSLLRELELYRLAAIECIYPGDE